MLPCRTDFFTLTWLPAADDAWVGEVTVELLNLTEAVVDILVVETCSVAFVGVGVGIGLSGGILLIFRFPKLCFLIIILIF